MRNAMLLSGFFFVFFVIPYSYWLLILFVVELELVAVG